MKFDGGRAPQSVVAVGAHPDDVELYGGGILSAWAVLGAEITIVVLTDGRLGTHDENAHPDEIVERRAHEARAAAQALGATIQLGTTHDGALMHAHNWAVSFVAETIRTVRPDVVIGHDPWRSYELHPDHRAAGFATTDAFIAARELRSLSHLDHLMPHRPAELWLAGSDHPNHYIDVGAYIDEKMRLLCLHESQFAHLEWEARVRRWNERIGAERGYRYAEAFRVHPAESVPVKDLAE